MLLTHFEPAPFRPRTSEATSRGQLVPMATDAPGRPGLNDTELALVSFTDDLGIRVKELTRSGQ